MRHKIERVVNLVILVGSVSLITLLCVTVAYGLQVPRGERTINFDADSLTMGAYECGEIGVDRFWFNQENDQIHVTARCNSGKMNEYFYYGVEEAL